MRILSIALLFAALLCSSCRDKNTTVNGYKISYYAPSTGKKPPVGDLAFVNLYFYQDGKMMTSTRENDRVMSIKVHSEEELKAMKTSGKPNPIYEAVALMSVGDSIRVNVPITEEIKKDPRMANAKEIYYDIVMEDAKTEEAFKAEKEAGKYKMSKLMQESIARVPAVEAMTTDIATQYREGKLKDKLTTTASGLKYMIIQEGEGAKLQLGTKVNVHYYGVLTNGAMFDNSFSRGQPLNFPLGAGRVIKGWDEGFALLKGGDRAVFFVPSELGYGKAGSGQKIPGDSELIFYVEVL